MQASEDELPIRQDCIDRICRLFPTGIVVLAAPVSNRVADLHTSERKLVQAAVEKRKAEFSTGRVLAARALNLLKVGGQPILKGANNEPLWPSGIIGSISHCDQTCIVVVGRKDICGGIGIDVEKLDANVSNVAQLIMRDDEVKDKFAKGDAKYDELVRLTFSAKESVFKAVFPYLQRFIEFEEVSLAFDKAKSTFGANAPEDRKLDLLLMTGTGGHTSFDNLLVTGFFLPSPE